MIKKPGAYDFLFFFFITTYSINQFSTSFACYGFNAVCVIKSVDSNCYGLLYVGYGLSDDALSQNYLYSQP